MPSILENLKALCLANGVAGAENGAALLAARLLHEFADDARVDDFGNVMGTILSANPTAKTVLLDAHIDEIGLIVTSIDEKGFLKVDKCGGVDRRHLSAQYVTVHGKREIPGVIGSKPPHLEKKEDAGKIPEFEELFIDIGMNAAQAEEEVSPGDRITLNTGVTELKNGRVSGKALDNRAGVAAVLEALRLVKGKKLPFHIAVQFTGREETGGQGAQIAAFTHRPDYAVVVDVSHAEAPGTPPSVLGKLGEGTLIGVSPALDQVLSNRLISIAGESRIPFQYEVMGGTTGTNADDIGVTRNGVRTMLLSIPQRFMHTPSEVTAVSDIEATGRLIAEFIQKGDEE